MKTETEQVKHWGIAPAKSENSYRLTTPNSEGKMALRAYINFIGMDNAEDQAMAILLTSPPQLLDALHDIEAIANSAGGHGLLIQRILGKARKAIADVNLEKQQTALVSQPLA